MSATVGQAQAKKEIEPPAEVLRQVLEIERSRSLEAAREGVELAAEKLLAARRASCFWPDAAKREGKLSGLVGFVARTGTGLVVDRIGEDPRYDAEVDNGRRSPRERFLAAALPAGPGAGDSGVVEAVLGVARGKEQEPFGSADLELLEALAREAGPLLRRRRLALEQALRERETELFRREALDHHQRGTRSRQEPLRLTPTWIHTAYRALLLLFALGLFAVLLAAGLGELPAIFLDPPPAEIRP